MQLLTNASLFKQYNDFHDILNWRTLDEGIDTLNKTKKDLIPSKLYLLYIGHPTMKYYYEFHNMWLVGVNPDELKLHIDSLNRLLNNKKFHQYMKTNPKNTLSTLKKLAIIWRISFWCKDSDGVPWLKKHGIAFDYLTNVNREITNIQAAYADYGKRLRPTITDFSTIKFTDMPWPPGWTFSIGRNCIKLHHYKLDRLLR